MVYRATVYPDGVPAAHTVFVPLDGYWTSFLLWCLIAVAGLLILDSVVED